MKKGPKVLTYEQAYELALRAGSRFPAVVAAQFALETDWGRRTANAKNNLFNIKWHEGAAKRLKDRGIKVTKAAKPAKDNQTGSVDYYMQFDSIEDAFIGYQNFIESNPRYGKALKANTAYEYLKGIKEAGYAEDEVYVKLIGDIARGAGIDLHKEQRYTDQQISEIKKKGQAAINKEKEKGGQTIDNFPQNRTFNTPKNIDRVMRSVDWSTSTLNDRQYERMERFIGARLSGDNMDLQGSPEEDVAAAAMAQTDLTQLEPEIVQESPQEVEEAVPTVVPNIEELGGDLNQIQQYDGGVQPNGRVSTFTREEDLRAQGNTYNPLNLF